MVDSSGIPRAFDVGALRRELADLKRQVAALESRRNFVSLDRIVEGGTIGQGVGEQLTEVVQEKIVVNGDNLAVDALDGRVITGSLVQTNEEPELGAKMTDGGVVVHGKAVVGEPTTGSAPETKMRAVLDSRRTKWSGGADDKWPGLWLESTPPSGAAPPLFPPGVTVGTSNGVGLILQSANDGAMTPNGEIAIGPGSVQITANPVTGGNIDGNASSLGLGYGTIDLGARDASGTSSAYVSNAQTDGVLRIYGKHGVDISGTVTINGEPYTPGGGGTTPNPSDTMRTVITGLPAGAKPIELISTGSAVTSGFGVFTITFPAGVFPTACMSIQVVPTTGTAGIPVVNAGRLNGVRAEMVIPSATNTNITYSYRAVGY